LLALGGEIDGKVDSGALFPLPVRLGEFKRSLPNGVRNRLVITNILDQRLFANRSLRHFLRPRNCAYPSFVRSSTCSFGPMQRLSSCPLLLPYSITGHSTKNGADQEDYRESTNAQPKAELEHHGIAEAKGDSTLKDTMRPDKMLATLFSPLRPSVLFVFVPRP
jgi:hypothetical protein